MYHNYICVCCKKVDNFREKWMGKDNINRQQPFRVKRTLSGADFEQQSDKRTPATKTWKELNFSTTSLSGKPLLKRILQLLKKRLFQRNKVKVSRFDMLFVQIWWGFLVVCSISLFGATKCEGCNIKAMIFKLPYPIIFQIKYNIYS